MTLQVPTKPQSSQLTQLSAAGLRRMAAWFFIFAFVTATTQAATIVWSAASGTDTNWSNAANWTGGLPGVGDDVKFFDTGTNALGVINNVVDASASIGSLHYANTNNSHATLIASGQTLTVNSNLGVYTFGDLAAARNLTNVITGAGGTLTVTNPVALISINEANTVGAPSRATLNLSGLDLFNVTARAIGLGSTVFSNSGGSAQRCGGMLILAKSNYISLGLSDTLANYQTSTSRTNAIELSRNPGNNPGITSILLLGQTNVIALDSISCGMDKSANNTTAASGLVAFNPAVTNSSPGAYFRGLGGAATTRVKWWSIGDGNASSSSSNGGRGTNDFSNGTVDMLIDVLSLGRECNAANTGFAGPHSGVLTFNSGIIDVNTAYLGNQAFVQLTSIPACAGTINVNGASALLKVNSTLILGYTLTNSIAAPKTIGVLNIRNGTVQANSITVGAYSATNVVTMTNALLVLSNTIASPAKGLTTLTMTNSTLQLSVNGVTNVVVTNLVAGGATNVIFPASVAVFSSYPKQVTLVKYVSLTGTYNFGFGANTLPTSAPDAYLSNNVANGSIDLVLPTDPRPGSTAPSGYSGSPGDNVTIAVTPSGAAPLTYQWRKDGGNISDGATGNGSSYAGTATASLGVTNAQPADNGNYTVVITNAYGSYTSSIAALTISAGNVAPVITGPNNTTVVQGNNATLSASASGVPVPALQWQKNGVDMTGETNSSLTITNAQYPADQATYSIIATNVAGAATNSAVLTVIVPPVITVQPVSLTVTNTQSASFSVTATGVPAPTYQWKKNGNIITDATNSTLNFPSASPSDIATYSVVVQNAADTVTSTNATLTVNSTMIATTLTPANSASGVLYDTPLSITFSQAPSLRSAGTIKIYAATNSTTPVDTINLVLGNPQQRTFPGDGQSFTYFIVSISGNTATIYPHYNVMSSNQTYYVTVDNGVFTDASGAYFVGITDTNAWRFATKPGGAADPTNIVVAANGSGDFLTVQGAVNSITAGNTTPRVINIRTGDYNEIVDIAGKHNVTFRGQSRGSTIVGYANNATFQSANGGTTHARMAFKINANDIAIENMTVTNRTPVGGSQAEALMIETNARRLILNNANVASFQDTILGNQNSSEAYFNNTLVQGQFDYIWGGSRLFFTNCEIKTLVGAGGVLNSGNVTASRTDLGGSNGFSFTHCVFTRVTNGIINTTMAGGNGTANGNVALVSCNFDDNYTNASAAALALPVILWEFGNSNLDNTIARTFGGTILTEGDSRLTAARTANIWLNGWNPQLAPNILTNPASVTVTAGQPASFSVTATGIPDPTYQWLKDGTNIVDATNATYNIPATVLGDAGSYQVVVTTVAGSATSSAAMLTVNAPPNTPPVFTAPIAGTNIAVNPGVVLSVTNTATDSDVPAQTLTYSLLTGPTNASVSGSSGVLTWRPLVTQADSVNPISVVATDNGTPALSATNDYTITVGSLLPIGVTSAVTVPGQLTLTVTAAVGPDYAVEVSTNLTTWSTLFTTNAPPSPFTWDADTTASPMQFYRIKAGPPLP